MKDRLVSILCGICLVLCFTVVVSWARSTVSSEGLVLRNRYAGLSLSASEGALIFTRSKLVFASREIEDAWRSAMDPGNSGDLERWRFSWSRDMGLLSLPQGSTLGFGIDVSTSDATRRVLMPGVRRHRVMIQVPHWALVALTGIMPGWWLHKRNRARRARVHKGLCRKCGFEMGEVYHSCPKCGERAPLPEGFPVIVQD